MYINAHYVHGIPIGYRLFEASKEYLNKYKASFCLYIKYLRDKVIMWPYL